MTAVEEFEIDPLLRYASRVQSTGRPYHGINPLLLGMEAKDKGYVSPYWSTYNAVAEHSGMERRMTSRGMRWVSPDGTPRGLRQGEKGTRIVLWKEATVKDSDLDTGERVDRPVLLARMYYVFNADLGRVLRADRRGAAGVRSRASAGLSPPPGSGPGGV